MKTLKHLFTALLLLCSMTASAQSFEVDGINYNVTSSTDKTVEVSGGSNVLIPESVTYNGVTYSVTSIGGLVFNGRTDLTGELVIPNSVTSIGNNAFQDCSGLTSVVIGNSVTSIGSHAFVNCSGLTSVEFNAENCTAMCSYYFAFQGCTALSTVTIGENVKNIPDYAFCDCSGLTSVVIPNSVTSIGGSAFRGTPWLDNQPDGVVYAGNVLYKYKGTMPANTSIVIKEGTTAICSSAFRDCSGLIGELVIPNSVTSIGSSAFSGCSGLTGELVIPDAVTSIGSEAFRDCNGLTSLTIGNSVTSIETEVFIGCSGLTSIVIGNGVTSIGHSAFNSCSKLTSIEIPNSVTSIGSCAFIYCSSLTSVTIGNGVTSIGERAFEGDDNIAFLNVKSPTPPSVESGNTFSNVVIVVPETSVDVYKSHGAWNEYSSHITSKVRGVRSVDIEASEVGSALRAAIGDEHTIDVYDLKVKGSINSYDAIVLRTKMPLLRYLDLSEATIVASDFPYYNNHCTRDNEIGDNMFCNTDIVEIVLPGNITKIGNSAFYGCDNLQKMNVPQSVTSIGSGAFDSCSGLKSIVLPNGLTSIEAYCFASCSSLKEIVLPPTVRTIGWQVFSGSALEEIRIPSSVESIEHTAFLYCNTLKRVYTYTVEPLAVTEGFFPTAATATLYLPSQSRENYYFAAGWNSFLKFEFFDEPYEYFYVNNDYTLNDNTGYIEGKDDENPDADINAGGGFIVEGEQGDEETPNQSLGDVNVGSDGEGTSGSIIGDNNLHIDDLHIRINVKGGRWYFFAFPFDIFFEDITMENGSDYVFRYYDGEERAQNGKGGWKDINENHLKAARGYIFQCSANDVLVLNIEDVKFKKEDKYNELVAHVSENLKDASWNFTGNPYLSYYDMADMDYTAPVTVWDGEKYVAIRPGDDDYHFAPYEAFFVQKPEGQEAIGFDGQEQMTKNQSNKQKEKQAAARRARGIDPERLLINLVLGNGTSDDRTRIVFNERQSLGYETSCDATKFETAGVAQLYTIGSDKVHYAINERPADNGRVVLGYTAPTAGFYTIEAQRMDVEVYVKDFKTGTLHNLKDGAYSFGTDAGTFNDRFEILLKGTAPGTTGIDEVKTENGEVKTEIYDLQGRKMQDAENGIYIINGEKVVK